MIKLITVVFACLIMSATTAHARPIMVATYAPDRHGAVVYHPYPPMLMGGHARAIRVPRAMAVHAPARPAPAKAPIEAGTAMGGHGLVAKARMYVGTNPTGWPSRWCGKFMAMVAGSPYTTAAFYKAANWLKAGRPGPPGTGAIVVYGHHVGVLVRLTGPNTAIIISGNDGPAGGRLVMERERSLAGARFRYL